MEQAKQVDIDKLIQTLKTQQYNKKEKLHLFE
jgi:hypothetical protein